MHRRNIKQAFVGEGDPNQEGLEVEQSSDEDVEFKVVGGHIAFVVPPGTTEEQIMDAQKYVHAELILENGSHITIGIHEDTVGADIALTGPGKGGETVPDLSEATASTQGGAS